MEIINCLCLSLSSPETRVKTTKLMASYVTSFYSREGAAKFNLKIPGCLRNACLSVAEAVENAMVSQIICWWAAVAMMAPAA